ncbi:MAG: hypothetical protein R3C99_15660 [Pirellulaceae bacterium]|nr:hypothetical protein [Planctomycetales bacterium]
MLKQLWQDESGGVNSAELVLIITMLTIGILVGMKSFRDAAVTEFADLAQAVANLNQSYSYSSLTITLADGTLVTAPSYFVDTEDFCDTAESDDNATLGSKCVNVCATAGAEGAGVP